MKKRTKWKERAEELEAEVRRVRAYAFDYGNADGECEAGYLQQDGYICHKCSTDDYRKGCPHAAAYGAAAGDAAWAANAKIIIAQAKARMNSEAEV